MFAKNDLVRVVRNKQGEYLIDTTSKANGRGAYICKNKDCVVKCCEKRYLNKAFKAEVKDEVYANLKENYELIKD